MIKAHENQIVHNAMIDAIVQQELQRQHTLRELQLEAEVERLRMALAVREQRDRQVFALLIDEANRKYPTPRKPSRTYEIIMAPFYLIAYGFARLFEALES